MGAKFCKYQVGKYDCSLPPDDHIGDHKFQDDRDKTGDPFLDIMIEFLDTAIENPFGWSYDYRQGRKDDARNIIDAYRDNPCCNDPLCTGYWEVKPSGSKQRSKVAIRRQAEKNS